MTTTPDLLDPPREERERFRALRASGDPLLRNELIEDHLWIARQAARRFASRGETHDDLFQVASLGLVKAVDRFDPERESRFAAFAMPTVMGEVRRHFRDRGWALRVSRRVKDLHLELRAASERLTHDLARRPTLQELADDVGVAVEEVLEAIEAASSYRTASIDAVVTDSEGEREAVAAGMDDEVLQGAPERVVLWQSLQRLPERDRRAVYYRFYFGMTQSEIAQRLGVSQVHVSRILRSSLARLGDDIEGQLLEAG